MPIKLPKGLQKRKSSGNALDEVQNPPVSSFRVIERREGAKSFDGGRLMRVATAAPVLSLPHQNSFGYDEENLFSVARSEAVNRGSGGTEHSLSTTQNDSAASSTRLSVSTNPSSIDAKSDRNVPAYNDIPVPPPPSARPGLLNKSGRTWSLGVSLKSSNKNMDRSYTTTNQAQPSLPPPPTMPLGRDRAATASTASTATPPRLFDSDLALDSSELDGFGNMFEGFGNSSPVEKSNPKELGSHSPGNYPPSSYPVSAPNRVARAPAPKPIMTARNDTIEASPYSWTSQDSHDGLIRSPSPSKTITQDSPPVPKHTSTMPLPRQRMFARKPLPPNKDTLTKVPTQSPEDENKPLTKTTSNRSYVSDYQDVQLDAGLVANAELATMYEEMKPNAPKPAPTNKVMTPAQFERYKQQQEMDRRLGASNDSDTEEEVDKYDDDDEVEREKQAAKQRRKQEAHLSVYRQQMMKVTGEQAGASRSHSSLSAPLDRLGVNNSSTSLDKRLSKLTTSTQDSEKNSGDDEEDEDVPLGILAAHGFPNKNRPPAQLTNSSSNPNLRGLAQQQSSVQPSAQSSAQSVAPSGSGETRRGSTLPVFARQLPQDPYYGAGLVNPTNRESLAMHAPQASPANPLGAATAHPVHPAGLVGVIAGEEKARAMRRGSPNAQGTYDPPPGIQHPGMMRSQTAGSLPQMGYPGMMMAGMPSMPMMSPGDQAQIQMSQQMSQMMQMQMQWMQSMQQMMGNHMAGGQSPGGMTSNYLAPPTNPGRPQSIMNQGPPPAQRTMSTLSSNMANWNQNSYYAPSIAPSERSNIGLAPRYRPVSTAADVENHSQRRASTFTSASAHPWSQMESGPRVSAHVNKSANAVGRKSPLAMDDDDDEAGWAEMKAKKDKKQKSWKLRKGQNGLEELYNGVL